MGAASAVKEQVLSVLQGTSIGKKLASEAEEARAAHEARVEARAKLDEAEKARKALPKLADAVAKAEAAYNAEMRRLAGELHEAQRAYREVVHRGDRLYARAEGHLRRTAHPLCHDNGPVVRAVEDAIRHLRHHRIGVGGNEDMVRRQAKLKPLSEAREDVEPIERARDKVRAHDQAEELSDAFRFALAELRDLQLEVAVEPTTVREIIEALPERCAVGTCGHPFNIEAAVDAALRPKEVR